MPAVRLSCPLNRAHESFKPLVMEVNHLESSHQTGRKTLTMKGLFVPNQASAGNSNVGQP